MNEEDEKFAELYLDYEKKKEFELLDKTMKIQTKKLKDLKREDLSKKMKEIHDEVRIELQNLKDNIALQDYADRESNPLIDSEILDVDVISTGISTKNIEDILLEILRHWNEEINYETFIIEAESKKISKDQFDEAIKRLKTQGKIYQPKKDFYRIVG